MASKGYISAILNQLEASVKKALQPAFDHVLSDFILGTAKRAANFRWVKVTATTPSTAGTEFSIAHGLGSTPTWVIPALQLDQVGSQIVPLTVSRAPDATRIYLTSSSTGASITLWVEY